jgi:hypothetical protein
VTFTLADPVEARAWAVWLVDQEGKAAAEKAAAELKR